MKYQGVLVLICCAFSVLGSSFKDENAERVGNPDDLANIERPCPTFDLNCIRKFFSTHAQCRSASGPAPDPLTRPQADAFVPIANYSVTVDKQEIRGLNGRVEEFYVNKETDNLVFAVEFRNFNLFSNNTYFIFHRRAREAVVTVSEVDFNYPSLVVTAVIPKIDDLQIQNAECTGYSNEVPRLFVEASTVESSDPQVQTTIAELMANLPIASQEFLLTESYYYIVAYIQYNICDFGLTVDPQGAHRFLCKYASQY